MLSHKKPDSVINVKVEFGEGEGKVPLDNIAKRAEAYKPKERVTYKMIKEYIEAKYGFKVHTRYNIQELSDDENRNNAINDLKMAVPKLKLISKDDRLVEDVEKFIQLKNKEQFNILVNRLRKDLYTINEQI